MNVFHYRVRSERCIAKRAVYIALCVDVEKTCMVLWEIMNIRGSGDNIGGA